MLAHIQTSTSSTYVKPIFRPVQVVSTLAHIQTSTSSSFGQPYLNQYQQQVRQTIFEPVPATSTSNHI